MSNQNKDETMLSNKICVNNDIIETLRNYIIKDSNDFAIVLTGPWGCGKTFFWNNYLSEIVKQESKTPVYVSLYGVKEVNEIDVKIFFEIFSSLPSVKKSVRELKFNKEHGKMLLNTASSFGLLKRDKYRVNVSELYSLGKVVLCFDDLERSSLTTKEILGHINNYLERDNIPTIIIANEEQIEKDDDYFDLKEKSIGRTIRIKNDPNLILYNLIESSFKNNRYAEFLLTHQSLILETFKKSEMENFRIIKQTLHDFELIYNELDSNYNKENLTIIENEIENMLCFTLSCSFEIRKNSSISSALHNIKSNQEFMSLIIQYSMEKAMKKDTQQEEPTRASLLDDFRRKYFGYTNFKKVRIFFESIHLFITTGIFHKNDFKKEITKIIQDKQQEISDHNLIFDYTFTNPEQICEEFFDEALKNTIIKLSNGEMYLSEYPKAYLTFRNMSKIIELPLDSDSLKQFILNGMIESSTQTEPNNYLKDTDLHFPSSIYKDLSSKESNDFKEIEDKLKELNDELKSQFYKNKSKMVCEWFEKEEKNELWNIFNDPIDYWYYSLSTEDIRSILCDSSINMVNYLYELLEYRQKNFDLNENELAFLKEMYNIINNLLQDNTTSKLRKIILYKIKLTLENKLNLK
ncbi:P-loop NTPase fold protein [Natranaerobius thermophilus]|uniref:P-loop NTPase fold protein n=1 Tax=Natranaerobius thermophilus TaxID=375929 RepID=UPI002F3F6EF0